MTRRTEGGDEPADELDLDADAPPAAPPGGTRRGTTEPTTTASAQGPPRRPLRRRLLAVAVGVVVAAVVVAVGVRAQRAAEAGPPALDGTASAEELFPVLAAPARPGTALPDDGLAEDVGVEPGSERLLAVAPAASYWVALQGGRSASGGVCLVVRSTADALARGGICTSAAAAAGGVALPAGGTSGTLLPEGADTRAVEAAGDAELVPGLWVDPATAAGVVQAAVDGASSRLPAVQVTVRRGTGWLPVLLTTAGRPYAVVLACLRPVPVRLSLDGEQSPEQRCPDDVLVRQFTGTGEPVQVGLQAPDDLVWAAEVVTCTGPASDPTC